MTRLEDFKAGALHKHISNYKYFIPNHINQDWNWIDPELNRILERAAIKLGELNSYSKLVPNVDIFISLYVSKEAVVSSKIEGTQTHVEESFFREEEILPERKNDWNEVQNYIEALNKAVEELGRLPISTRLIKKTHKLLLRGVRGEHKQPGEYRKSQNWIGGANIKEAVFVPPSYEFVDELMGDLEKFINNDELWVPDIIKIAMAHYQFETIHPFLDGNGRIGRLLITLFLVDRKILNKPILYLSDYFEKNRYNYYNNLTLVRTEDDMLKWLKFFLIGVAETAEKSANTLSKVLDLKLEIEKLIIEKFGRKIDKAHKLLYHLFTQPVVQIKDVEEWLDCTFKTANDLVADFVHYNILREKTGHQRNRIFSFRRYIEYFED